MGEATDPGKTNVPALCLAAIDRKQATGRVRCAYAVAYGGNWGMGGLFHASPTSTQGAHTSTRARVHDVNERIFEMPTEKNEVRIIVGFWMHQ